MISTDSYDWKRILLNIYMPSLGSLWVAPNYIWNNGFASNKDPKGNHPSVVGYLIPKNKTCWLIPGSSKNYNRGSCVFKTIIKPNDPHCPITHFIIRLRMTYLAKDVWKLRKGWMGVEELSEKQIQELKLQMKFSLGINV